MKEIDITIKSKNDYINQYNDDRLNPSLIEYIFDEIKGIPFKNNIKIIVNNHFEMTKKEKEKLIDNLRSHFGTEISEMMYLEKNFFIVDFIMLILGFFVLVCYFVIHNIPVLSEILLIIGWLFIWEAIYNILFDRLKNHIKMKKFKKMTNCKIEFKE